MELTALIRDREDRIWISATDGGLAYTDRHGCVTLTTEDGLAGNSVSKVWEDRQGRLWMGTFPAVSCYDGKNFTHHQVDKEGDVWNHAAYAFYEDDQGVVWMASYKGGVFRFDGQTWSEEIVGPYRFGENYARSIVRDPEGYLWFTTGGEGAYRYDGQEWKLFTAADGLVKDEVRCLLLDSHGWLWFATEDGGLSRYDGQQFVTVSEGSELGYHSPMDLLEDQHGHLWIATRDGGIYRYDGEMFQAFTSQDGLVYDHVMCLCEDRRGHLWIGTLGGGVSRYDGQIFQTLSSADGLPNDEITSILEDRHGDIWLSTRSGLTRYRSRQKPPTVQVREVMADRRYDADETISVPVSQPWVRFSFQGHSLTTRPEGMVYMYRLVGVDADWQSTREGAVTYRDLTIGAYSFQVQAVDRDLNYSPPVSVALEVTADSRIQALQEAVKQGSAAGEFIGESAALARVQLQLAEVAQADLTVLILGETGTGKGLAARMVHELSRWKEGPFIPVNCGAIPEGLVESELFGHERGAFTGAVSRKLGKVELAAEGTLFLDEIGDMSMEAQVRLLRLLEEKTFERVGGTEIMEAQARVVAATNRDLSKMVQEGTFREDLFFRLQVFPVQLPPLRERREDIPLLVTYFMEPMAAHLKKEIEGVSSEALGMLKNYGWPGNVRELKHTVERAVIVCQNGVIQGGDIALGMGVQEKPGEVRVTLEEHEREYIRQVLEDTGGVIRGANGAATILGIPESTLRWRIKKLGIKKP